MEEQLQQQQFQYHFPAIPPPQEEQQQENFFSSQQLLNLQQTQLNPLPRSEIQQQTIKKRALNGQGSGRKAPGRVAAAGAGEIVEVEGGHIIRSTGRKDRHSKVCTAKGPRDRRVRLSAHTAIQFYDVQDRLGYDRPSKAVDWLINKAKSAIDELDELPPWKPVATANDSKNPADGAGDGVYGRNNDKCSSLLPPSMDSNSIAAVAAAPAVEFQSYPGFDLQSRRDSSRSQDLKLSLQSFQDPMIIQSNRSQEEEEEERQSPFGFDNPPAVTSWDEPQPPDLSRFQRLIGWNFGSAGNSAGGGSGGGGYMFVPPPQQQPPPLLFGHGVGQAATHFFTQRGTLQSNNTPLVRACTNGESSVINQDHHHHHQGVSVQPVSFSGIGFASSNGGFSSFHIPARIQGDHEEEEQDGNKPSSVASTSRH